MKTILRFYSVLQEKTSCVVDVFHSQLSAGPEPAAVHTRCHWLQQNVLVSKT